MCAVFPTLHENRHMGVNCSSRKSAQSSDVQNAFTSVSHDEKLLRREKAFSIHQIFHDFNPTGTGWKMLSMFGDFSGPLLIISFPATTVLASLNRNLNSAETMATNVGRTPQRIMTLKKCYCMYIQSRWTTMIHDFSISFSLLNWEPKFRENGGTLILKISFLVNPCFVCEINELQKTPLKLSTFK